MSIRHDEAQTQISTATIREVTINNRKMNMSHAKQLDLVDLPRRYQFAPTYAEFLEWKYPNVPEAEREGRLLEEAYPTPDFDFRPFEDMLAAEGLEGKGWDYRWLESFLDPMPHSEAKKYDRNAALERGKEVAETWEASMGEWIERHDVEKKITECFQDWFEDDYRAMIDQAIQNARAVTLDRYEPWGRVTILFAKNHPHSTANGRPQYIARRKADDTLVLLLDQPEGHALFPEWAAMDKLILGGLS